MIACVHFVTLADALTWVHLRAHNRILLRPARLVLRSAGRLNLRRDGSRYIH